MSKAKPSSVKPPEVTKPTYLPWPAGPKELGTATRSFRIHRLNAYEWQAYVTEDGTEQAIGKPDLIDILKTRIIGVMKVEGQREFMDAKQKRTTEQEAAHELG